MTDNDRQLWSVETIWADGSSKYSPGWADYANYKLQAFALLI